MTSSPVPRPRCRPDGHQAFPAVAGAATLASLVLMSLVLGPPADARAAPGVGPAPPGSHSHGGFEESVAEVIAFDPAWGGS